MGWRRELSKFQVRLKRCDGCADLADEIRAHLAFEELENLQAGMSAEEAHARALQRFGNITPTQERSRDMWTWIAFETSWQDVRYALRQLRSKPGFTAVAVITLALGIGANTAIFSVVNAVLLKPLPFKDPSKLVQLFETEQAPGSYPLNGADYFDWEAQNRSFSGTALYGWASDTSVSSTGEPERAQVTPTQANFFEVLGVAPLIGRSFAPGEDQGKHNVAVLSYGFWQRHFAGDEGVMSKTVKLDGETYNVIGVMPKWLRFDQANLWVPMDMTSKLMKLRGNHNWNAIARIRDRVTLAQAQQDLLAISERLEKQYPDLNSKVHAQLVPLKERLTARSQSPLLVLLGAVVLVLLIACANVANLLLARATSRQREIALRASLGAGRFRLIRQLLTESVVLALAGAALGLLGAWWCVRALDVSTTVPIPHSTRIAIDGMVLLFTVVTSVGAGILFGLAPALQTREIRLNNGLKSGVVAGASGSGFLRNALVVGEIALTFALLIGATLLLRSFAHLRHAEIGVNSGNLVTAGISLPDTKYKDSRSRRAFFDQLLERIRTIPGVEAATLSTEIPLEGGSNGYIKVDSSSDLSLSDKLIGWNWVTSDYFRTFGIPLERGRLFTPDDVTYGAEAAQKLDELYKASNGKIKVPAGLMLRVLISESAARTFWRTQDAVGKTFQWNDVPVEVIGVVGDVKEYGIRANTMPQAYFPFANTFSWGGFGHLSIKTRVAPLSVLPAVRAQTRVLDDSLALFRPRSMEQVIAGDAEDTQFQSVLLGSFAGLALLLATIGLYGVMSYVVVQRTREIGIRMALGAGRDEVLGLVLRKGAVLTLAGLAIGTLLAIVLTRAIASLLFGIGALDPLTFVLVPILLAAIAFAAHFLPARRATKIDPILALRYE